MFLRAFFAAQVGDAYSPDFYEMATGISAGKSPKLANVLSDAFDLSATSEIIAENEDIFAAYREHFGFTPRSVSPAILPTKPDIEAVRDRLVEIVTSLSLDQSLRIQKLEREVTSLRNELRTRPGAMPALSPKPEIVELLDEVRGQPEKPPMSPRQYIAKRWRAARKGLQAWLSSPEK